MGRFGITAAAGGIIAAGALGTAPASATRGVAPYQREAETLARLVRADARARGPAATTLVRSRTQCCGRRVVNVYYKAQPRTEPESPPEQLAPADVEEPRDGAYHLRLLETVHGRLLAVSIHEYGTEPGYVLGTEPDTHASSLSYELTMKREPAIVRSPEMGTAGWTVHVSYSYVTFGTAGVQASSFQLQQAVTVAKKAARHAPVEGEPNRVVYRG